MANGILIVDVMLMVTEASFGAIIWWGISGANKRQQIQNDRLNLKK